MTSFAERALSVVRRIPRGKVFMYKEVARRAGRPNAYRAVGTILKKNFNPAIPCHRVIKSSGEIGGYNQGVKEKLKKLKREGIAIGGVTPRLPRSELRYAKETTS